MVVSWEAFPRAVLFAIMLLFLAVVAYVSMGTGGWVTYNADMLPNESGWMLSTYSKDPNLQTIREGVLDYLKPVAAHHYTYRNVGDLSNAAGTILEARVRVVQGGMSPGYAEVPPFYYGAYLAISDGSKHAGLSVGDGYVQLGRQLFKLDTLGGFHTYRLELKGNLASAYVDGKLVAASIPVDSGDKRMEWGVSSSSNTGYAESLWDYVKYKIGI